MTVCVVLASLIPILWETGVGSDVMKPIAAPIVGGMITSTVHVLILVPVFFAHEGTRPTPRHIANRGNHTRPQNEPCRLQSLDTADYRLVSSSR